MEIQMDQNAKILMLEKIAEKQMAYVIELANGLKRMNEIEQQIANVSPKKQLELYVEALKLTARAEEIGRGIEDLENSAKILENM